MLFDKWHNWDKLKFRPSSWCVIVIIIKVVSSNICQLSSILQYVLLWIHAFYCSFFNFLMMGLPTCYIFRSSYSSFILLCPHFFFLWRYGPTRAMASTFMRFLDHIQRRITVSRTPLDEWSALRRDLYLTTHNTHNRQTSMPPVGFEPTISAGERPQTYALDRGATGTGTLPTLSAITWTYVLWRQCPLSMLLVISVSNVWILWPLPRL